MSGIYSKKILIIESDQALADAILRKVTSAGYDAYHSLDGTAGLEAAQKIRPDLVVLDMLIPPTDGNQVLDALRKDPALNLTKVIIISETGQIAEIERALELGVKDYVIKAQFDPEEVLNKINVQLHEDGSQNPEAKNPFTGKKVLIVEDDKFLRDLVSKKFENEKISLCVAVDGEQGLSLAVREKPDLILLDILLPGLDGFGVLENVRAIPELKHTIIIMLSNFGQREDIEKAMKLGANLFLIKAAITLDEVVEKAKELLSKQAA